MSDINKPEVWCCATASSLAVELTAANARIDAVLEGQELLKQQTVRIRKAIGNVPEDMDTEEAARRMSNKLDQRGMLLEDACARIAQLTAELNNSRLERYRVALESIKAQREVEIPNTFRGDLSWIFADEAISK